MSCKLLSIRFYELGIGESKLFFYALECTGYIGVTIPV